ncbi:MAG TPA: L-lysine 6-transaminase [Gemmatimonadales bacterium]|nr:L-lysine 6-transaminase [Gemmatimonadales bacterium]
MPRVTIPAERVFPVLRENILVDGFHIVIDLERSHGNYMVDALEGKEYLDCYSFFSTLPLGHNHPKLADDGFRHSLMVAALSNPANSDVYSPEYAAFVETFRRHAVPAPFRHLFFVAGGSPAVENAMKAAFDWKAQRNRSRGIAGGADKILHFRDAFHGRTGYALSTTNTDPLKTADFPKFDWPRISNPAIHFPMDESAVAEAERRACDEIEQAFTRDPHGIAAILIEPIQAEGGDNHFRPHFLKRLREYADHYDALLIFDEVQTGLGTTGSMWAYQQLGVVPDLLAFGKKTQVCGFMSTGRIDEVERNVFRVSSRLNSTWGGNLVDMVRCARYLEVMAEDRLVDNAARMGNVFRAGLEALAGQTAEVTNPRGRGFMLAIDLPSTERRNAVRTALWQEGLACLTCGPRSIRFRPPLIFGEPEVQRALEILERVLLKKPRRRAAGATPATERRARRRPASRPAARHRAKDA